MVLFGSDYLSQGHANTRSTYIHQRHRKRCLLTCLPIPQCVFFSSGTYATLPRRTDSADCKGCPAGKKGRASGTSSILDGCADCQAGEGYNDQTGQASCTSSVCPKGTYASAASADVTSPPTCDACPKGRYSGAQGLSRAQDCSPCPIGRYSRAVGQISLAACVLCPIGTKGKADGQASLVDGCVNCTAGANYNDEEGQVTCKLSACKAGT